MSDIPNVELTYVTVLKPQLGEVPLLDHGYLKFITNFGTDGEIVEAARMSTDKGFIGWGPLCRDCADENAKGFDGLVTEISVCTVCGKDPDVDDDSFFNGDEKLLKYLYEHKHATPFEMAGLVIEVQAPIFVFREWHRHRTQSFNEMSGRYIELPNINYIPSTERLLLNAGDGKNKQAGTIKGAGVLNEQIAEEFQSDLQQHYDECQRMYKHYLDAGVPKELARVHLPLARYSRMRASANLRNWLAFLTLRMDPAAQHEIRVYANAVGAYIEKLYPRTWELFRLGRK